jgi:hypothetical protein
LTRLINKAVVAAVDAAMGLKGKLAAGWLSLMDSLGYQVSGKYLFCVPPPNI